MSNLAKAWNSLGRKRWLLFIVVGIFALLIIFGANLLSWWNWLPLPTQVGAIVAVITATIARLFGEAIIAAVKNFFKPVPTESVKTPPHQEIPDSRIPRPPQYGFVARYDDEGNDLVARTSELLNQNRAVALVGPGGLGKTALAAEIVRTVLPSPTSGVTVAQFITARVGDGGRVVWTSADGRADFSLGTLLDEAATQLGNPDVRTLALEQKSNAVREMLGRSIERPYTPVIVIDNFETIAAKQQKAITDFVNTLSCAVLITSRVAVDGAERVNIGAMTETEAREFLRRWIASSKKKNALTRLIDEIAKLAERNPMVMRWIVGQLERAQRMSDVLDELSRGQGNAATRVFGRSFSLLNADAQATLLSLALFVPSANRAALAFTAGFDDDIKRLNDALKPLADLQLLETDANNECLSVVGLTRRFTTAQLNKDANAAEYRKRFVDYFVNYARAHRKTTPEDLNALEDERENLFAAMDVAFANENWQSVMRMMNVIGKLPDGFLYLHGYWDEAIARWEQTAEAALRVKNAGAVAGFLGNMAAVLQSRGEYEKARDAHMRALEVFQDLKDDKNIAVALHCLGMIAQDQGDYEMARTSYTASMDIEKKLGNLRGVAGTLHQLGIIEFLQGAHNKAQIRCTESLEIFKKLDALSEQGSVLHQLGNIAYSQRDYEMARVRYGESLEIEKKLGNLHGIALTTWGLGNIAFDQSNYDEAEKHFEEALGTFRQLGDQNNTAGILNQLGNIAFSQGRYEIAQGHYAEGLEIKKKLGDQSGIAFTLHNLGMLAEIAGDKTEAARLFRESLEILERLKSPNAEKVRKSLERVTKG